MSVAFNTEDAFAAIDSLIERRGADFCYEKIDGKALYFDPEDGEPSCALGVLLEDWGCLADLDAGWNDAPFRQLRSVIADNNDIHMTDDAFYIFLNFQIAQDAKLSYGECRDLVRELHLDRLRDSNTV